MKNSLYIFLIIIVVLTSCDDYLDQVPSDRQTIEEVFQKKATTEQYLANVYTYIRDDANQHETNPWTSNSDEMVVSWAKYPTYQINIGRWDAASSPFSFWGAYYDGIRAATYFINHIDDNAEMQRVSPDLIPQYKAEARFLRAYFYFMLMRQYGPVVIVGEDVLPVDVPASELQIARTPFDECVAYVVSEFDEAAKALPLVPTSINYGRATRGAALAFKSRVLLYAASPLYNGNTDLANFKNQDGTPLISQSYDENKWQLAANAAKAVMDLNLYLLYKDPENDPIESYRGVLLEPWNDETIFARKDNSLTSEDVHSNPRQAGGWNGMAPSQEMVDAYLMEDGLPISGTSFANPSPLYSESGFTDGIYNMYVNREPRFYASITYNNALWDGGTLKDPTPINFEVTGPNSATGHVTDWSRTGYLVRKNVSPFTNSGSGGTGEVFNRPLVLMRLGEIYLNYAEALNEYNPGNPDILTYVNMIRERAGVPLYGEDIPAPVGQDAMRDAIWRERRIELAFEYLRWFDIRRWKKAEQYIGHDMHGMDVFASGDAFYTRVVAQERVFRKAYYWFPITQYELDRGKLIVQNPGW
ncbi:RagB/SusD family nutrient uptake outer membrane protein [Fulvivirga ligni]|uniref:RagB/SusD family nutrient uptake outer membrane protein n=1 Tax=Fulvivirga ligni TaxID=2904246 RepID=UPI001F3838DB|nr:RagB/SusD family nutrient uptake outer membrane protein [Fulvivirga ligni]UII19623.1 RagB/SusD family nutrient uptake outer membrane protein [Fulvivirga ligni]